MGFAELQCPKRSNIIDERVYKRTNESGKRVPFQPANGESDKSPVRSVWETPEILTGEDLGLAFASVTVHSLKIDAL